MKYFRNVSEFFQDMQIRMIKDDLLGCGQMLMLPYFATFYLFLSLFEEFETTKATISSNDGPIVRTKLGTIRGIRQVNFF